MGTCLVRKNNSSNELQKTNLDVKHQIIFANLDQIQQKIRSSSIGVGQGLNESHKGCMMIKSKIIARQQSSKLWRAVYIQQELPLDQSKKFQEVQGNINFKEQTMKCMFRYGPEKELIFQSCHNQSQEEAFGKAENLKQTNHNVEQINIINIVRKHFSQIFQSVQSVILQQNESACIQIRYAENMCKIDIR